MVSIDLIKLFFEINSLHFDGFLDLPRICWNPRLRSSAGRFVPGSRQNLQSCPPKIEIASYLLEERESQRLIYDTLAHETIHYWLWVRNQPYGHTPEFLTKMKQMGVSRYNPVPRLRSARYVYYCQTCNKEFLARKKLTELACAQCCKQHSHGKYDPRFSLVLKI